MKSLPRRLPALLSALALVLVAACTPAGGGSSTGFTIRSTDYAVDPASPMEVVGNWVVYLAKEALVGVGTATDLNGDGDTDDEVAVAVRISKHTEYLLEVATTAFTILNNQVYLVVDEAEDDPLDTKNWDGDVGTDNLVLLHWSFTAGVVTFVDVLDPAGTEMPLVKAGGMLYYASATPTAGGDETTLRTIDPDSPLTPVPVENAIGGGELHPTLLGEADDLVFLLASEIVEGVNLNGDLDTEDEYVLALLDGKRPADRIKNTEVALAGPDAPFAALSTATHDWLAAFLVNEEAQGETNLNPSMLLGQATVPDRCIDPGDLDTDDDVLHFLAYADFLGGGSGAVNTALAGRDRVLVVEDFVATLSFEVDSDCDLSNDGNADDAVLRWAEATTPVIPPRGDDQLWAVEQNLPGGARGVSTLRNRFIAVISESRDNVDHDDNAGDGDLVAWLRPANGPSTTWEFHHLGSTTSIGTGVTDEPYAGASWLSPDEENNRLAVTYQESVPPIDLNNSTQTCDYLDKDNDTTDEFPIWLDFEESVLDFDGVPFAVVEDNPGIVLARGYAFFRVSESEDNLDYNADGDKTDVILMRHPLSGSCDARAMGTAHAQEGPVVVTDGLDGAAFLASEIMARVDFNGDGDTNDTVVRYFDF